MNLLNKTFIITLLFLSLDLISKELAKRKLSENRLFFNGKVQFILTRNYGIAFNKFSGKKKLIYFANIILFLYLFYLLKIDRENIFGYSIILAGGLGNFISRLKDGYVTDFIYFNIKKWPVFNIADFEIFIGVGIILIKELIIK